MVSLPEWLSPQPSLEFPAPACYGRASGLARKGLGVLVRAAATLLDDNRQPSSGGGISHLDARAKIAGLVGLTVVATLVVGLAPLALSFAVAWAIAVAGRVSLRRMALVLLAVPAFTLAIAAPAASNLVTEGVPVLVLCRLGGGSWGPWHLPEFLTVTDRGLFVAARFVLRSAACVSLGGLLAASTRPQELFKGLRGLGVPPAFVMVAAMMTRYLSLLLQCAQEIHLAKLSRSLGAASVRREQAWAAAGVGELYRKTRNLADQVADAMVSRGYTGEIRTLGAPRFRWGDGLFVGACAAFGILLLCMDQLAA